MDVCSALVANFAEDRSKSKSTLRRKLKSIQNWPSCPSTSVAFGSSESVCEGFFVKKHLQNTSSHLHIFTSAHSHSHLNLCSSTHLHLSSSAHLHIYISPHLHILIYRIHLHIFTSAHAHSHLYLCSSTHLHLSSSAHLHIYISPHLHILTSTSLLMFIFTHLHLCSSSHPHIYISAHLHILTFRSHIFTSRSSLLSLLRPGAALPEHHETQASVEIVRVECAKCRRECDLARSRATLCGDRACRVREMQAKILLSLSGATLCGDRACRGREMQARVRFVSWREMQARVRFVSVRRNPLRRSCVSRARNAGEIAFWPGPAPLRRSCVSRARNAGESAVWVLFGAGLRSGQLVVQM